MIIKKDTKGRVVISTDNEVVTAEAPLTSVTLRVTGTNVTLKGIEITGSELGTSRPSIVYADGSYNLVIDSCVFKGDGKQEQGVYANGFTNLQIKNTVISNIGVDPIGGDHAVYVGSGDFVIDGCDFSGCAAAGVQLYPSSVRGVIKNSKLHNNNWGIVSYGNGCDVTVDNCQIYDNHGSRGYGVHADSGGHATVKNSYLWNNQNGNFQGNVTDAGGNTFSAPPNVPPTPVPVANIYLTDDPVNKDPNGTVWIFGWNTVPNAYGYRFFIDDKAVSWTADPVKNTVRMKRGGKKYSVQILLTGDRYSYTI